MYSPEFQKTFCLSGTTYKKKEAWDNYCDRRGKRDAKQKLQIQK